MQLEPKQTGVFKSLIDPFRATRYHSLVVDKASLPSCLEVNAWTVTAESHFDEVMGLRHKEFNVHGVQFHPESIMTEYGHELSLTIR